MPLQTALKEWSVAVRALAAGETLLLLRKGGIREAGGRFTVASDRVLLYPTFEHQQPHLLKSPYQRDVQPVKAGWHPQTITLLAWAQITHIFQITTAAQVERLRPFHIWSPEMITERLQWKPQQPLYGLALQTYRLPAAVEIDWRPEYGGCRSWIELAEAVEVSDAVSAIAPDPYRQQVEAIEQALRCP
ncbi:DUF1802 family protein [Romeria aff. gracilis LEGE 07310]|uniref:DUF1802 family protein n=1 Tax=Vasconcelosia minhoensis LEGE 07310 TaxID=915328 RepID=A0A8J7AU58_9CYAN|nr:DUF1802 family protein [Romeria gracilis]MBE9076698.1 DUF1802 family protein [Romeria aff. gracilis LEGE 07310]